MRTIESFCIEESQPLVVVSVYDVLGREVERLVNGVTEPGNYELQWDAAARPSGVYSYRIQAGSFQQVRSMLLVR